MTIAESLGTRFTRLVTFVDRSLFVPLEARMSKYMQQGEAVRLTRELPASDSNPLRTVESNCDRVGQVALSFHELFVAHAHKQPSALAATFHDRSITYAELDARSNQLAQHLIATGVGPDVTVAVCVRPSLEVLVAMIGIWKARGVYLPLDPTHPEALIGRMLDEAQPRWVLTYSELRHLTARSPQLCFDSDASLLDLRPTTLPRTVQSLSDAAYIFYTSGTTGKPKGVVATHGNLAQYMRSAADKYGFRADDVFVSIARYTFSISLFELVSPLCCGASVRILDRDQILTPERLCRALGQVTVLHAGPSLLGALFRYVRGAPSASRTLPGMRHASSGGDMVLPSVMAEMKSVFPNAELFVIYGCTEISCMGTTFRIPRATPIDKTLVGKPFPGVALQVLDSNREQAPLGVAGEIWFAGKGIVRGYHDRPELTRERFVELEGRRFYQTGDIGRVHSDGNLEILGRSDFQVQLRGIRVELTGIEKTVQALGLAAECAVVARVLADGDARLVAFVVRPIHDDVAAFRRALALELPEYMLPHQVVALEALPLTANGKLDRGQLRDLPVLNRLGTKRHAPPTNDYERTITEVFARVLGLSEVGAEDSFFDLGGDSLPAVVALTEIERAIGVAIPPHVLFQEPTARALANRCQGALNSEPKAILLNGPSGAPTLFMLSGVQGYRELAKRLADQCQVYGVFTRNELRAFAEHSEAPSVEQAARDYLAIIRAQQPVGPYRLLGFSFAGIVAYEVAQQLREAGEEVQFLALIDSMLPEWTLGWRFRRAQVARLRSAPARDLALFAYAQILKRLPWKHGPAPDFAGTCGITSTRSAPGTRAAANEVATLEARRDAVNTAAAERYLPKIRPYPGEVTLIVSGERMRMDPLKSRKCGWDDYLPSVISHTLHAHHHDLMSHEPHVSELAAILADRLRSSQSQS